VPAVDAALEACADCGATLEIALVPLAHGSAAMPTESAAPRAPGRAVLELPPEQPAGGYAVFRTDSVRDYANAVGLGALGGGRS